VKGFLLDTNVVSEARKGRRADKHCVSWIAAHRDDLYLSVLVTGEIRRGIESIRRRDAPAAGVLERWLRQVETTFEDRILPIDSAVADRWERLMADRPMPVIDGLLAATALVHRLTLATRNVSATPPGQAFRRSTRSWSATTPGRRFLHRMSRRLAGSDVVR